MFSSNCTLQQRNFQVILPLKDKSCLSKLQMDDIADAIFPPASLPLVERLECKVQQLMAELQETNQQLCHEKVLRQQAEIALKQEKQLAEHREYFISMASHEFRIPLNIISLSTSLLKRHRHHWTEEKKLQYLQRLETAIEQMRYLMDKFLTLDKAEVGKLNFEPETFNLIQFCQDILAELDLCQNHHSFTFVCQDDCEQVCADKKLLQPILMNLLSNAIKYSPVGSTVDLILSSEDKKMIFQIKDSGIGIPAADQPRLFEPFYRGGNTGNIPGNGLGLALVQKLVDLHHGQITVTSEVSVGTTFTIILPC
ncbi:MAG: HAMP domain-containing histidine kinase [Nostoc sp. LLA-1]|nr:HAMP domain-containing histidine kinase [Cyanocohniella sp. LLY]